MTKTGVIGVGSMGQNHARLYSEISDLVGVYDVDKNQAKRVAERFGTKAFSNAGDLIESAEAVSICTPTKNHYEVAMEAIGVGKPILLEKPFTGDSKKARSLCLAAEKEGTVLAAGFVERFNPVVSAARDALKEGKFGKLISLESRRVSSFPSRIRDVGVIMDLAIHDIDVIRHITSSEILAVYALGGRFAKTRFEDFANLLLEIEGGVTGFVETNWLTPMKVRRVSLTCSESFVQLDYIDQSLEMASTKIREIDPGNMFQIPLEYDVRRMSLKKEEPLKRELEDFLAAVKSSGRPHACGWDAVANLRVCEAASRSLKGRKRIEVPQER